MAPETSPRPRRQESRPREADQAALQVRACSGDGVQVLEEVPRPASDDDREDALRVEVGAVAVAVAGGTHLHKR